jgi:hypothetical protein
MAVARVTSNAIEAAIFPVDRRLFHVFLDDFAVEDGLVAVPIFIGVPIERF